MSAKKRFSLNRINKLRVFIRIKIRSFETGAAPRKEQGIVWKGYDAYKRKYDFDGNGVVDVNEKKKHVDPVFTDTDGNGVIDEADTLAIHYNMLRSHRVQQPQETRAFSYRYDKNGNMTFDEFKNLTIRYNYLNLPDTITLPGHGSMVNTYLADGTLLRRSIIDNSGNEIHRTDYQGEFLFVNDTLNLVFTEEGYVQADSVRDGQHYMTYCYTLTDYLGHTRVVVNQNKEVVQETAYYPYGMPIAELSTETKYNYLYTGKEFLENFGVNWYDHHARYFDPQIGRWWAIDPALQMGSPYMAMGNNPMMMVDTDGEWVWAPIIIGALIGAGGYTASVAFSDGGFDNWNWGQFAASVGIGAVSGAITPGLGEAFGGFGGNASTFGGKILNEIARATVHGHVNGVLSAVSGGSYQSGFASGGLGSVGGSAFQSVGGNFANSGVGTVAFSAAAGGIGAELSGGDFWRGAATGATVGLLNHSLHEVSENQARKQAIKARYSGNYNLKQLKDMITGVGYVSGAAGYHIGNHMSNLSRFAPIKTMDGRVVARATSMYRYGFLSGNFAVGLGKGLRLGGTYLGMATTAYAAYKFYQSPTVKGGFDIGFGLVGFLGVPGMFISAGYYLAVDYSIPAYLTRKLQYGTTHVTPYMNFFENGGLCFIGQTNITLGDGTLKAIKNIQIGDTVLTYDSEKNKVRKTTVTSIDSPMHSNLAVVIFSKKITNVNTQDHPYYVEGKGWSSYAPILTKQRYNLKTSQLNVGDKCFVYNRNKLKKVKVKSIIIQEGTVKTYNLTGLKDGNSYFANGVLVSNENVIKYSEAEKYKLRTNKNEK